jgi:hypothetical protein
VIDELYLLSMDVNIFHQKFSSLKVKKTEFVNIVINKLIINIYWPVQFNLSSK